MLGAVLLVLGVAGLGCWAWQKARRRTYKVEGGRRPEIELPYEREFELYHNAL